MGKAREKRRRKERKAQRREARQEFSRMSAERQAAGENVVDLTVGVLTEETIPEAFARLGVESAEGNYSGEHAEKKLGEYILGQLDRMGVPPEAVNAYRGSAGAKEG